MSLAIDEGARCSPRLRATPPVTWRDARLRTPAGVVTLRRVPSGVAVVVFGNADEPLRTAQRTIAQTLLALH